MKEGDFVIIYNHLARCIEIDKNDNSGKFELLYTDFHGTWTDWFSIRKRKIVILENIFTIFKNREHLIIRGSAKPFIKDLLTFLTKSNLT